MVENFCVPYSSLIPVYIFYKMQRHIHIWEVMKTCTSLQMEGGGDKGLKLMH